MEFSFQFPPPSKFHAARNFNSPAFRSCKILLEFCLTKKGSPPSKLFQQFRFPCVSFQQNSIGILSHENAGVIRDMDVLFPGVFGVVKMSEATFSDDKTQGRILCRNVQRDGGEATPKDSLPERAKRRGRSLYVRLFCIHPQRNSKPNLPDQSFPK